MRSIPLFVVLLATSTASAELRRPDESPHASITQTVGVTDITVAYSRPAVKGRPVWGQLVPYGATWRAGANLNTIVTFSTDAKVNGKALRAGSYGLHVIPSAKEWVFAFSSTTTAWGSFTYDAKEDVLRVTVTPRQAPVAKERLEYRFDDLGTTKATLVLGWEKLEAPLAIEVDTPKNTMALARAELRGSTGFDPANLNWAATYWLENGGKLEEALRFNERSLQGRETAAGYNTRAAILQKQGKGAEAAEARKKAETLIGEGDLNQRGYRLLNEKKHDEALAVFRDVVKRYPESWNAHDSLAEALATTGDKQGAIAEYEKALAMCKDADQKTRIRGAITALKK